MNCADCKREILTPFTYTLVIDSDHADFPLVGNFCASCWAKAFHTNAAARLVSRCVRYTGAVIGTRQQTAL